MEFLLISNESIHRFESKNHCSPSGGTSKKLDQIIQRLDLLEELVLEKPEYEGLATVLRLTRLGIGMYCEPLKIADRVKKAENYLQEKTMAQDDIACCIIQAVAIKEALNISAITRQATSMRGNASRR
jgi:hypothetical protein